MRVTDLSARFVYRMIGWPIRKWLPPIMGGADNVTLDPGSGGATIATDDDGTAQHQYVKVEFGADNTQTKVTSSAGLPVTPDSGGFNVANAGTFAVQEDGDALTALQVIDNPVLVDDAAFTPATSSVMMAGAEFDDVTPDSVDEGDAGALRMSSRRELYVQIRDAAGNERGINVDSNGRQTVNLGGTPSNTLSTTGGGTESSALRVTLANDSTGVLSVDDNGGSLTVDNTHLTALGGAVSGSEVQVDVVAALPAGTNAIGKLAANSGVDIGDVDILSIAAGTNTIGDVGIASRTTGGTKTFNSVDLDESEEQVASSACTVYTLYVWNLTAAPLWLQMFNATAASIAPGTDAPDINFMIPANADSDGAGVVIPLPPQGIAFDTALSVAITTGSGTDSGAPGANDAGIFLTYQD